MDLSIGVATTRDDIEEALNLVRNIYAQENIVIKGTENDFHTPIQAFLPKARIFIVRMEGRIIGTLTLLPDSKLRLKIDRLYPEEMDQLRKESLQKQATVSSALEYLHPPEHLESVTHAPDETRVAELSLFALDPVCRERTGGTMGVSIALMNVVYKYGALTGLNSYVCEVIPAHANYYKRFWFFEEFASGKTFPEDNAPAIAVKSDFESGIEKFRRAAEQFPEAGIFTHISNEEEHQLRQSLHPNTLLTPETLRYFLMEKSDLWVRMSQEEQQIFRDEYMMAGCPLNLLS